MSSLFGVELPTPVNFIIAFVFVLLLIGAAAWLVRRFGAAQIEAAARGRQPRLAVVDSAAVDGRRKLVIIRRDNVEHLLMIGGPRPRAGARGGRSPRGGGPPNALLPPPGQRGPFFDEGRPAGGGGENNSGPRRARRAPRGAGRRERGPRSPAAARDARRSDAL